MGPQVEVKKLNAINFMRGKQINYCPATQAVELLALIIFPGLLGGPKFEEKSD